jgi:hypothetical protein
MVLEEPCSGIKKNLTIYGLEPMMDRPSFTEEEMLIYRMKAFR